MCLRASNGLGSAMLWGVTLSDKKHSGLWAGGAELHSGLFKSLSLGFLNIRGRRTRAFNSDCIHSNWPARPLAGFGDLQCFLGLKMLFRAKEPNYVVFFPVPWAQCKQSKHELYHTCCSPAAQGRTAFAPVWAAGLERWGCSSRSQDKQEPGFDLPSDPCQLRAPCL